LGRFSISPTGVYKDEKSALKDIVADYVQRKIESYNAVILRMVKKCGKDFKVVRYEV